MKNRINIGTASIILIFIILCLSVFSLLSLSDGKSALVFAERHAASVTAYYQTDSKGQRFIQDVSELLQTGSSAEDALEAASAALPEGTETRIGESGSLICEIPMTAGQALRIELDAAGGSVLACYVYNKEDYAIDNRLPVWVDEES